MGLRPNTWKWLCVALMSWTFVGAADSLRAQETTCARGDFVAVVDEAAAALRALNQDNKAKFQDRLRDLKARKSWSREEYLRAAKPYVMDPQIKNYDGMSARLLGEISALGQEGSKTAKPNCAVLIQLRARMDVLVRTQNDKWVYMFKKIDTALAQ